MAGRKQGIDPAKVKTFADWVNYSDRNNVRKTTDNRLLVLNPANPSDLEAAVEIPHSYGADFRTAIVCDDPQLRASAQATYDALKEKRSKTVVELQKQFATIQKQYMEAMQALKSMTIDSEKRKKATEVADLGITLAAADAAVRHAQYPGRYAKIISSKNVSLRLLNNASMDDRKIESDLYILKNEYETVAERIIEVGKA